MQRDPQTYALLGAAMEVHRQLGPGFLEAVYHEALAWELALRGIPFLPEVPLPIHFKGHRLATSYRVDLICYEELLVELKAQKSTGGPEEGQVLNYLKASGLSRALLLNFGTPSLQFRRFVWSHSQPALADGR